MQKPNTAGAGRTTEAASRPTFPRHCVDFAKNRQIGGIRVQFHRRFSIFKEGACLSLKFE